MTAFPDPPLPPRLPLESTLCLKVPFLSRPLSEFLHLLLCLPVLMSLTQLALRGWHLRAAWCLPGVGTQGRMHFQSFQALRPSPACLGPGPSLLPHSRVRSQGAASGLGVSCCLCSGCHGEWSARLGMTQLFLTCFCTLHLSPVSVSASFPSVRTAFHSVVLGDTYNIPLDPRGKQ